MDTVVTATPTDADLLRRSETEPELFHRFVDRHFRPIHRYLHRRVGRDLADDLSAEVFALAFEQRTRCQFADGSALPWLYGIATNLARRHWRSETRRLRAYARTGVDEATDHEESRSLSRLDASGCGAALAAILAALPRKQREALMLYAIADLSYEEIGLALEAPLGSVKTWLHRARATARHQLERGGCDAGLGLAGATEQ